MWRVAFSNLHVLLNLMLCLIYIQVVFCYCLTLCKVCSDFGVSVLHLCVGEVDSDTFHGGIFL
jgi:hypothetical protein